MRTPTKPLHVATIALLVGGIVGAVTSGASPAAAAWVGDAVQARAVAVASYAGNADRVDGFHAVKAGTPAAQRRNKVVATGTNGRLPDNIIRKAPDADRLDGVDGSAYRFLSLDLGAGVPDGSAATFRTGAFGSGGLYVPDASGNSIGWGFVLPPNLKTGATLTIRVLWHINQTGCTVALRPNSASHDRVGLAPDLGDATAGLTGPDPVTVPGAANTTLRSTFTAVPPRPGTDFKAGDSYAFSLYRSASSDTCSASAIITGVSVTY